VPWSCTERMTVAGLGLLTPPWKSYGIPGAG
jgi:hypothetical protein